MTRRRVEPANESPRVVLITGASSGIGRAVAQQLAGRGYRLVLCSRSDVALAAVADECRQLGASDATVLVVPTDVRDAAAVDRLFEAAVDRFERVDAA